MQPKTKPQNFEAAIRRISEALNAAITTDDFDFGLRVACAGQFDSVRIIEVFRAHGGVQQTDCPLVCREVVVNNTVLRSNSSAARGAVLQRYKLLSSRRQCLIGRNVMQSHRY